jgi:hypothetical protein
MTNLSVSSLIFWPSSLLGADPPLAKALSECAAAVATVQERSPRREMGFFKFVEVWAARLGDGKPSS